MNTPTPGECLCGAFAKKGELQELAFFYPDVAKRIVDLEKKVWASGHHWGWEEQPKDAKPHQGTPPERQFLCVKCNAQTP